MDCERPTELAAFWALALGYVEPPPPIGFTGWNHWFRAMGVPEDEWDDGAYLVDPAGTGPKLSLLKVPEKKVVKNRMHIDIQAGGGRQVPWEERWPRVQAKVTELVRAGATVLQHYDANGRGDHVVMQDPEGNEFCVV
jgi:hypothetical protein